MLYNQRGERKYLSPSERNRFIQISSQTIKDESNFCLFLALTGCRISEALQINASSIDTSEKCVVIETLKRRKQGIYRAVPLPEGFVTRLSEQIDRHGQLDSPTLIWPWSRTKAWSVIKRQMVNAAISGSAATPKGLRHAFAIEALRRSVPLNLVQKWMGHARLETTAIYANAMGEEEREIASRMWAPLVDEGQATER